MRIFNIKDAEGDIETFFGPSNPENPPDYLYIKWLKQVWIKHLFKEDPAWVSPIVAKRMPSFFKTSTPKPPQLEVQVAGHAAERIYPQTEWDIKDAEKGILFYYKPSQQTLFQYAPDLAPMRDYLRAEVFRERAIDFDVRKFSVVDTENSARKWHEEHAERMRRQAEERRRHAQQNNNYPHVTAALKDEKPMVEGVDYAPVKAFTLHGTEYVVFRLLSEPSLYYETSIMQHCVWSYGPQLRDGTTVILSIRDRAKPQTPLVTVEVHARWPLQATVPSLRTIQIQGFENKDPDATIRDVKIHWPSLLASVPVESLRPLLADQSKVFKVKL